MKGTPLVNQYSHHDSDETPGASREARALALTKRDQVTDSKGRKRFHGAFTGGWSAGYFNSTDTKEGFTPASFSSSRSSRASHVEQSVADFYDEEDLDEFATTTRAQKTTDSAPVSAWTIPAHRGLLIDPSYQVNDSSSSVRTLQHTTLMKSLLVGLGANPLDLVAGGLKQDSTNDEAPMVVAADGVTVLAMGGSSSISSDPFQALKTQSKSQYQEAAARGATVDFVPSRLVGLSNSFTQSASSARIPTAAVASSSTSSITAPSSLSAFHSGNEGYDSGEEYLEMAMGDGAGLGPRIHTSAILSSSSLSSGSSLSAVMTERPSVQAVTEKPGFTQPHEWSVSSALSMFETSGWLEALDPSDVLPAPPLPPPGFDPVYVPSATEMAGAAARAAMVASRAAGLVSKSSVASGSSSGVLPAGSLLGQLQELDRSTMSDFDSSTPQFVSAGTTENGESVQETPKDPAVEAASAGMFGQLTMTVESWLPPKSVCKRLGVPEHHVSKSSVQPSTSRSGSAGSVGSWVTVREGLSPEDAARVLPPVPMKNPSLTTAVWASDPDDNRVHEAMSKAQDQLRSIKPAVVLKNKPSSRFDVMADGSRAAPLIKDPVLHAAEDPVTHALEQHDPLEAVEIRETSHRRRHHRERSHGNDEVGSPERRKKRRRSGAHRHHRSHRSTEESGEHTSRHHRRRKTS